MKKQSCTKLKVIRENAAVSADTITVYFSLTGDLLHGENGTHSPVNWIERQSVNIPKAATVKYITELMLNNRNIPFVSDGVYISSINGISEFDNGSRSGWMYRHNGKIADVGYAERTLKNGDTVEWFYTDDYTKETGYEGNWDNINEDKSQVTTAGTDTKTTTTPTEVKVSGNTATATVTEENAKELIKQAKENKSAEIVINVLSSDTNDAETVNLELDKKTVESIVKDTEATVTVKTPAGEITLIRKL